jgi:hypothetical protein
MFFTTALAAPRSGVASPSVAEGCAGLAARDVLPAAGFAFVAAAASATEPLAGLLGAGLLSRGVLGALAVPFAVVVVAEAELGRAGELGFSAGAGDGAGEEVAASVEGLPLESRSPVVPLLGR